MKLHIRTENFKSAESMDRARTPAQAEFVERLREGKNEVVAKHRHRHGLGSAHCKIKPTHRIINGKKVAL